MYLHWIQIYVWLGSIILIVENQFLSATIGIHNTSFWEQLLEKKVCDSGFPWQSD